MRLVPLILALFFLAAPARAELICLLVADAETGARLIEEGECDRAVTPASTFKLPLALIGFDRGLLQDRDHPALDWQPGEPDWGGAAWTGTVTPESWLRESVVWYSQRLTRALGPEAFAGAVAALDYGNADVSGDPGFDNGLERAWISSSLVISGRQQADFLHRWLTRDLPLDGAAMAAVEALATRHEVAGWVMHGKTGGAYPRRADRSFDRARGWGWYVGWAERAGRRLIVVRLAQDEARHAISPGLRSRDALFEAWPALAARL